MRKRKAEGARSRVEARVSLVGFDFSQPRAVPDRTTDRRHRQPSGDIPEAKPCRDARRAWRAHPNRRMLCTPRIPTGAPSYPSTSTPGGAHARPAGGGAPHLLETSCLAFESTPFYARVSIGREEAFREQRIGRPVGGWRRARGRARGLFVARAPPGGAFSCPPTPKAGWSRSRSTSPDSGYASIDLAWPSPPATGALYLADMNSPNSVVKDRSRHRRRGSRRMCVPASHNIS